MRTLRLTRWQILFPIIAWGLLFLGLSAYAADPFQALNIVGFLFLVTVPGLLTMLSLRIKGITFWGYASFTLAFSILELMLVGVIGNTLLPLAGIAQPLAKLPLLLEIYLLVAFLIAVTWLRVKEVELPIKDFLLFDKLRDWFLSFLPVIFLVLSIFGAIRLNNGASNILTMVMLGSAGVYLAVLIGYANKVDENTIPTAIFFTALSLLLMTSLRGWYITGHDIQTEYRVFELAKSAGLWSIAAYRDPYNACLSITILPTIFSNLLKMDDPYIFKVFFQIFFAFCPVLVYMMARNWTSRKMSLLATIFFIGFPTFYTDMPFLTRQEIAFVFYGLMLYIIFNERLDLKARRGLFMVMGIGVILSHYSTTYTILIIFGLAVIARPVFIWLVNHLKDNRLFKHSALVPLNGEKIPKKPKITFAMVFVLFALSFVWTTIITQTGSSVAGVVEQTFVAVKNGFGGDNRSIDATSLLSFSAPDQNQELQDYITKVVGPIRAAGGPGEYFTTQSYSQYKYVALPDETVPLTGLGELLENQGVNVPNASADFGQLLSKLMEVLAPLGILYLLFRKTILEHIDDEIYLICIFCFVFIGMNIVLPVLSTEYGIFRAMQQSMFIIGPVIVVGSIMIGNGLTACIRWIVRKPLKNGGQVFAITLVIVFFLYSTSFLRQIFGGNVAELHLNNNGSYYDNDLIENVEVAGVSWLDNLPGANPDSVNGARLVIQSDKSSATQFESLTLLNAYNDIFPGVIQKSAYVFLNPSNVLKQRATIVYNSDEVTYDYPIQFLGDNKDLVYNNGGSEIYR